MRYCHFNDEISVTGQLFNTRKSKSEIVVYIISIYYLSALSDYVKIIEYDSVEGVSSEADCIVHSESPTIDIICARGAGHLKEVSICLRDDTRVEVAIVLRLTNNVLKHEKSGCVRLKRGQWCKFHS